ncbi:MAG: hypothetical protein H8Z69_02405 [Nanohaloarchaea archaeon]|nr:hypothetical protein [Candidatus Nanohaloarchaea archaeon]
MSEEPGDAGNRRESESSSVGGNASENLEGKGGGLGEVAHMLGGGIKKLYTVPRDTLYNAAGVYTEEGVNERRRSVLQATFASAGIGAAGYIGADYGADGKIDGDLGSGSGVQKTSGTATGQTSNQTSTEDQTNQGANNNQNSNDSNTPNQETEEDNQASEQTQQPTDSGESPGEIDQTGETKFYDTMNELPEAACYRNEGGVSGYFVEEDVRDAIGDEPLEDLTAVEGDIGYDIDFRDSDNDGRPDSYVIQLNDADSQEDLTVSQADQLFENANPNNYCD